MDGMNELVYFTQFANKVPSKMMHFLLESQWIGLCNNRSTPNNGGYFKIDTSLQRNYNSIQRLGL